MIDSTAVLDAVTHCCAAVAACAFGGGSSENDQGQHELGPENRGQNPPQLRPRSPPSTASPGEKPAVAPL